MISEATNNVTNTTQQSASAQSLSNLSADYTRFLTLLTAQISNQDPLAPMDASQFVTQLAQLSQVEQSVKTNANLDQMNHRLVNMSSLMGVGLLGKEVSFMTPTLKLEDGEGTIWYEFADPAREVTAVIKDKNGDIVRTLEDLPRDSEDPNRLTWDGLDDSGDLRDDGSYTVEISAKDSNGNDMLYNQFRRSTITQITAIDGEQAFKIGSGEYVSFNDLLTIG